MILKGFGCWLFALVLPVTVCARQEVSDTVNLEDVTVTAKTLQRQARESGYSISTIDIGKHANEITNLTDVVNQAMGVHVRREGGVGAGLDLSINGLSGNSVRYFLDGVPLDLRGQQLSLENLPPGMIDYIEIYKGVVPAYLGGDALGGAINLVSNRKKRNYLDASVTAGSFHTVLADVSAQVVLPKSGVFIRPSFSTAYSKNDYRMKGVELWNETQAAYVPTDVKRFHDDYLSLTGQLEAGVENRPWADVFKISASYQKTEKELQTGQIQSIVYGQAGRRQHAWSLLAHYEKRNFLLPRLRLKALLAQTWDRALTVDSAYRKYAWDGSYIRTQRNEITGRARQLRHYNRPLTTLRTNFDYRINERQSLNFNYLMYSSGNRRYDDLDDSFEPSNDRMTKHLLGLSYDWRLQDRWQSALFVKDYINDVRVGQTDLSWITNSDQMLRHTTKHYAGYGLSSRYTISPVLSVKASFEHTARLPLATELLGNGTTIYPNLALKPENSDNVNVGLYGHVALGKRHALDYEVGGFLRYVSDYIHAVLTEQEGMLQYSNVNDVDVKGLEGELTYRNSNWLQWKTNVSYQDARDMKRWMSNGKESVTYRNKLPNKPWLYSTSELVLQQSDLLGKGGRLRFSYLYQYVHWFYLTWEGYGSLQSKARIPSQQVHSATLSYGWHHMMYSLSLSCNNLWDAWAYDNYKLQKPGREWLCKFRIFIN